MKLDITTEGQAWFRFLPGRANKNSGELPKDRPAAIREGILLFYNRYPKGP